MQGNSPETGSEDNAPIVIFGSGRSGTTWIQDAIAKANGLRTIFEPLHPSVVQGAERFANRYVRSDSPEPELKAFMDPIFSGELRSIWTDYRQRRDRLKPGLSSLYRPREARILVSRYLGLLNSYLTRDRNRNRRLIVKFIRANLMLPWLENNYAFKPLFVVRHPGAVVASQLRMGESNWDDRALDAFKNDTGFWQDYLHRYAGLLSRELDVVQAHTTIWCIQNVLPLLDCQRRGRPIVYYENLMTQGASEWPRIITALDLGVVPGRNELEKPSQQRSKDIKGNRYGVEHMGRWLKYLSADQLASMQAVLDEFGVTVYKAHEAMPSGEEQGDIP